MNSVFVLMVVTATGIMEAPNSFETFGDCERVRKLIELKTYCVEKKPVNVQKEMSNFLALFKQMRMEMENDSKR